MRVTLKQIAEISGVSRATVDRVLNNRGYVSDEVRKRVEGIAKELGYKPNLIGKALACQKKSMVLAVVMPDNGFTRAARAGVDKACEELKDFGVTVEVYVTKDFDFAEQISVINYLIGRKVSGIALRPIADNSLTKETIDKAVESGIPVVTFNSDVKDSKRLCFVGQDLIKAGRVAGNLMGKLLNGRGKVAIFAASLDLLALNQRIEGFKEVIVANYPRVEIVDIVETKEYGTIAFQKAISLLENVKNLKGIYITSEPTGEVCKAVKFLGKSEEIKIVCFDFYPENVKFTKEGVIDFAIGQDPVAQGYKPLKILFEYLFNGKLSESDYIKTIIEIKESESIDILD
jgi:LacI family transcriptional regulator